MTPTPYEVINAGGRAPFVLVVDHASNHVPQHWADLGLDGEVLLRHVAWDPGAKDVGLFLAEQLDAPMVAATISRLVVDLNRPLGSATMMPEIGEDTPIPGNMGITAEDLALRIETIYEPYHQALAAVVQQQAERCGGKIAVIAIHSFTPVFKGQARHLHVGVLFDRDDAFGRRVLKALEAEGGLIAKANEPYSPSDEVYFTLDKHAQSRGLDSVMIEIRNDLIGTKEACRQWAERLSAAITNDKP
ncbi:N-formylglutamate amidohydrolase [Oryzibacter oryziterrae]|uniref:N-formylglutamate amidohydrolase n=1 Tax=Oryzibacter oryziterrae TaxID=2766474 RepID=UPI001F2A476C|nr:N-formylglutamate amidohydrolase [Oryzibacter oryziterrae]